MGLSLSLTKKSMLSSVLVVILIFGILPLTLYLWLIQGAQSVGIEGASQLLRDEDSGYVLVDVRDRDDYASMHLVGSINWPLRDILSTSSLAEIPAPLAAHPLLLLCQNGISSAIATRKVQALGFPDAYNVRAGIQGWIAQDTLGRRPYPAEVVLAGGETSPLPFVDLSFFQQATIVISLYSIKSLYMLVSGGLLLLLRRERSDPMHALRWGLAAFFVGEFACWVNFTFFKVESILLEYVHSVGMVAMLACLTWSAVESLERRIIRSRDPDARCALLGLCRGCAKVSDTPCAMRRLYRLSTLTLGILAFLPLQAPLRAVSYNAKVFGILRNLMHPTTIQLYELRLCPIAAIFFLGLTLTLLVLDRPWSIPLESLFFSIGVGHLGFSLLRMIFLTAFHDDMVWFVFWEESTELLLMGALAYLVWVFRPDLMRAFNDLLDRADLRRA